MSVDSNKQENAAPVARRESAWFRESQRAAVSDFWRAYEAHLSRHPAGTLEWMRGHLELRLAEPVTDLQILEENQRNQAILARAMAGDAGLYRAQLAGAGRRYAELGVSVTAACDLACGFRRQVLPRLVEIHAAEPERLSAAIQAMNDFADFGAAIVTNAFIGYKAVQSKNREEDLSTTLDSIGDAVIVTDDRGRVVRMNPVAERLLGLALPDCHGRPLDEVYRVESEETGAPLESPLGRVLRDGGKAASTSRMWLLSRDGARHPISASRAPVFNEAGAVRGVVLVFRDVSQERRAEAGRSHDQQLQLRAVQLEAENRRIEEANRLKSEFFASMSHELRTPLSSIIGFTELTLDEHGGSTTPKQKEFLGKILAAGRHLLRLINEIVDLAKVEAGKMEFRPEPGELGQLAQAVVQSLRATARGKNLLVELQVEPALGDIVLDPDRFKQVLYNYLSNALKLTPEGGRVSVRIAPHGEAAFRLEVEDSGPGLSMQSMQDPFVAFQQLEAGAAKRQGGTGLGLALTKKLVEAQGGAVGVRSSARGGGVFFAVLPRRPSGQLPVAKCRAEAAPMSAVPRGASGKR